MAGEEPSSGGSGSDSRDAPGRGSSDSEWTLPIAGKVSWGRALVVGTWLVVVASVLLWVEGPFWRDAADWFEQAQEAAARGDWRGAVENVRRAREADPGQPGLATFEGHARLRLGQPDSAAEAFRDARGLALEDVEPVLGLAEAHLEMGDSAGARSSLDTAASLPTGPDQRRRLGSLADASGDPELALESLLGPPAVGAASDRIRLALRLERWAVAVDLLREVLAAEPGSETAPATEAERIRRREQLAWALQSAGREGEALEEYRALASDDALGPEAAIRYAWILDERGRYAEARAVLDDVDETTPEVVDLRIRTALWSGRIDEAERRLAAALEQDAGDSSLIDLRGEVAAERERIAAARAAGRARAEAEARRRAEEEARARAARDTPPQDPAAALTFWRDRLDSSPADSVARRETIALLESFQRFDEAADVLRAGRSVGEVSDPETLLHLARLGEWADRPERVIRWTERYASLHGPPPGPRRLALARAYRSAGYGADALQVYEELYAEGMDDPGILLALAQLRAAAGDPDGAGHAYESYLDDRPGDAAVRLAYARHLASVGRLDEAAEAYAAYREAGGDEPVALERARVELGREGWGAAVPVARRAVREAEASDGAGSARVWEARLTLAEALRYDGRRGEAETLLRTLARREFDVGDVDDTGPGPAVTGADPESRPTTSVEAALWRARVARLRDRPLEAVRVLEAAPPSSRAVALSLAGAAMDAGLWARAGDALEAARAVGADAASLEPLQARLRRATRSGIGLTASLGSDDVDFTRFEAGLAGDRWAGGDRLRLRAAARSVVLSQESLQNEIVSLTVASDSLALGDATFVAGELGIRLTGQDEALFAGGLDARRRFEDGSSLGLTVDRSPLWEGERLLEPVPYSRIRDLGAAGVDLMETELEARGRKALGIGRAALASGGVSWYSDGNGRTFLYGHVELPVQTRVGRWISLQPNAYVEWFDEQLPAYASPSRYLAAGVRAVGIWEGDAGSLRLQANPHFFDDSVTSGVGLNAEARVARTVGPIEVSLEGFYAGQESVYDQYRAGLGVRWRPGGR